MERMSVSAFDTILIIDPLPWRRVIAVESVLWRVQSAHAMGVAAVLDPRDEAALAQIMQLTGDRGADCALNCAGNVRR